MQRRLREFPTFWAAHSALSPSAWSFAWALLACFRDCGLFFPLYGVTVIRGDRVRGALVPQGPGKVVLCGLKQRERALGVVGVVPAGGGDVGVAVQAQETDDVDDLDGLLTLLRDGAAHLRDLGGAGELDPGRRQCGLDRACVPDAPDLGSLLVGHGAGQ
jgi:hypothetical protein